ncbi:hypothetical protein QLH51_07150, partial [Sphingomonas sp. 2R-10]|nr:hypothetical protein [Sphingomonas sp. 2R-10]
MQLLSALTSTTSPLAMQAMPVLGQPTAGFAALLAGMAPAETVAANAAPAVRQIAALPGNALPVAVPDDATPVLPVSATEAVSMLPAETAGPKVAVPVAAAAVATLAKLLPDEDAPPPETATPAIPVLPPPPRFALPVPRGRKPEADVPRERPVEAEADDAVATDAEAMPPPACMPMPETVVPAELMAGNAVLPALVPPVAPEPAPLPPAQTILQDGSVVASDPATPMRTEKRAATRAPEAAVPTHAMPIGSQAAENAAQRTRTLPASRPAAAMAAAQVQPAIGQITPLPAERIVPVHVVVPPQGDGATADAPPAQVPASPQAMSFDAEGIVRPATPATATPMPVAAGQRTSIPVTGASVSTLRDAVPPVRQQVSTDDVTALATDPAIAARATIGAAPSSRASMASTHSASANQPVEMTVRPAPASAAIPTLASDGQVLDDILRQPLADVVAGAAPAVAVEGPRPAAPLRPFDPVAMTTPVAVAPATPRATTIPATPVRGFRQPVADGADNDRMAGTAAPNRVPAANAANAANAATAPVVAGDAAPPAQPTAQPVASLPPAPGVTAQAPADASVVRQPIAGEAAAPVVTVAAPGEPVAKPLPVTRIALP